MLTNGHVNEQDKRKGKRKSEDGEDESEGGKVKVKLSAGDFEEARKDYVTISLKGVKIQHSDVKWSDVGGKPQPSFLFLSLPFLFFPVAVVDNMGIFQFSYFHLKV